MSPLLVDLRGVVAKELWHLWRARARMSATATFALATLLLFSFAGGLNDELMRANAGGYLWLGLLLASTLALGESFRVETEHNSIEMLLLLPVHPAAIFWGKALGNFVVLALVGIMMVPCSVLFFDVWPKEGFPALLGTILLGSAAISAPGTMHAALASRARARDVLLPLLLFPLVVPCLIASVQATQLILGGDAMGQAGSWLGVLAAFVVVHWSLGGLLFATVVEE